MRSISDPHMGRKLRYGFCAVYSMQLPDERTQSFLVGSTDTHGRLIDSNRFSSYWKLVRVTAWVLRFVRHVRLFARFNPFFDDGFLRIGGRLKFADLSRKQIHLILLYGSHHFTALVIMQTNIRLHHLGVRIVLLELREEFWILRARQAIKKVL